MSMKIYQGYEYVSDKNKAVDLLKELVEVKNNFTKLLIQKITKLESTKIKHKRISNFIAVTKKQKHYTLKKLNMFEIYPYFLKIKSMKNEKVNSPLEYVLNPLLKGSIGFYPYYDEKEKRERFFLYFFTSMYDLLGILGDNFKDFSYQNSCPLSEEEKPKGWDRRAEIWNDILSGSNSLKDKGFNYELADEETIFKIIFKYKKER